MLSDLPEILPFSSCHSVIVIINLFVFVLSYLCMPLDKPIQQYKINLNSVLSTLVSENVHYTNELKIQNCDSKNKNK